MSNEGLLPKKDSFVRSIMNRDGFFENKKNMVLWACRVSISNYSFVIVGCNFQGPWNTYCRNMVEDKLGLSFSVSCNEKKYVTLQ